MMKKLAYAVAVLLPLCIVTIAWDDPPRPQPPGDISTGKYLYTKPDPNAKGGIKGIITAPGGFIVGVYAFNPNQPRFVYSAMMSGEKKNEFEFFGLPMEKYDLMVLYKEVVYEGLTLTREPSTLTKKDRELIRAQVQKSEPFFDQKIVYRLEGQTGKGNKAVGISLFIRNKESTDNEVGSIFTDHRRSLKITYMTQVGIGWQLAQNREVYVNFVAPGQGPKFSDEYRSYLNGIRVTDSVKDLGKIDLNKAGSAKP